MKFPSPLDGQWTVHGFLSCSFLVLSLGLIFGNFIVVKGLVCTEICIKPKVLQSRHSSVSYLSTAGLELLRYEDCQTFKS